MTGLLTGHCPLKDLFKLGLADSPNCNLPVRHWQY